MFLFSSLNTIKRALTSNIQIVKNANRLFSVSNRFLSEEADNSPTDDTSYYEVFSDVPLRNKFPHKIVAIQPNMKNISSKYKVSNAELELSELCALVESIPGWQVIEQCIHSLKRMDNKHVFGTGKLDELTEYINDVRSNVTAVVIGTDVLNTSQLSYLQDLWNLPVYDRYTMVLEIFRSRAATNEAKLQVSLAEIHYLKTHLYGMHTNSLDFQKEGLEYAGGLAERHYDTRKSLLRSREAKIMKQIEKVGLQRTQARENRKKMDIPIVGIVGYTNAGKTSLIKNLTGISKLTPKNKLFATLDIQGFQGTLPNNMKVLYLDTVGFISNMPDSLLNAFSITLEDVVQADLLVHVSDASHPDQFAQDLVVDRTLANLPGMPKSLLDNMIKVYNKIDLVEQDEIDRLKGFNPNSMMMSVKEGWGMKTLLEQVQDSLMATTSRVVRRMKIPAGSPILSWLYKEAAVEEVISDEQDAQMYLVKVVMTQTALCKFNHKFRIKKK